MAIPMHRTILFAAALCAVPSVACAQLALALDGQSSIVRPIGSTVTVNLTGGVPGMPVALALDV